MDAPARGGLDPQREHRLALGPVAAVAVAERFAAPLITTTPPPEIQAAEHIFELEEQAQAGKLTAADRFAEPASVGPAAPKPAATSPLLERERARIHEQFNGLTRFRKESTEHTRAWAGGEAIAEQFRLEEADWTGFDEQAQPAPRARVIPPAEPAPTPTPTHRPGVSSAGLSVGDTAGSLFNGFDD